MFYDHIPVLFLKRRPVNQTVIIFLLCIHDDDPVRQNTLLPQLLDQCQEFAIRLVDRDDDICLFHTVLLRCPTFFISAFRAKRGRSV